MSQVFQERHTTGFLWWKKTWYKYVRYAEEVGIVPVKQYPEQTIKALEHGK